SRTVANVRNRVHNPAAVPCAQVCGTCEPSSLFTGAVLTLRATPEVRSMHKTYDARTTSPRLPRSWRSRAVAVAAIVICYGGLFYGIAHMRAPPSSTAKGPPLFGPIISKVWVPPKVTISSNPWEPAAEDQIAA